MRIVIIGAGQVGSFLARNLSSEHDIVIIEKDRETAERLKESHDALVLEGDGDSPAVLEEAGIRKADVLLAVSGDDKTNILAATLAAALGVRKIILRVRDHSYVQYPDLIKNADVSVVNPGDIISEKIAGLVSSPFAWKTETLARGKIKLFKLRIEPNTPLAGQRLADLGPAKSWIFVAVSRNGKITIPTGETRLKEGDYVFALGVPEVLGKLKQLFGVAEEAVRTAVIMGCGRLGKGAAETLTKEGIKVKLIDSDPEKARKAAEELEKVLVFRGDATDSDALKEAGVESADYFLALTGDDEENVLSALLAKSLGARKTAVLYTKPDYIDLLETIGVDRAISVRLALANEILSLLHIGGVAHVALVEEGRAEVLEFNITGETRLSGVPLKEAHFPEGAIIGIALRGEDVFIPRGDYAPAPGDRVIVFSLPEAVKKVESILGQ